MKFKVRTAFLFLLFFLIGCSAATKGIKIGDEALARGNYYAAAIEYLNVLKIKPKHGKALLKLSEVAEPAYQQKLSIAEGYKEQGNLEEALNEYNELKNFIYQLKAHNTLNFVPVDIDKAIISVSASAAEQHYKQAELFFNGREFKRAIEEYRAALNLTSPYKDCREKTSESFYCTASDFEKKGAYRYAADSYQSACETILGYKDARNKAASIYYALGCSFLSKGYCRKAYEDLSKTKAIDLQFRDIDNKLSMAKECAAIRIAFVRFDNPTGRNIAGMALGDFIFDTIKTKLQSRASQFIRVLDREELEVLAREQQISEGMLSSEATGPINLEGVDYLIFGKINQVLDVHSGISKTRMADTYMYWYEVPYTDKKGKRKTRLKSSRAKMYYSLIKDKISLKLAGVIKVVESKTGAVTINHQISEEAMDRIAYADEFSAMHDLSSLNVSIPKEVEKLAKSRRELKDIGILANDMIDSISSSMSRKILSTLDQTRSVSDPITLKY